MRPRDVDELPLAGLTRAPAQVVRVPLVAESPVAFERRKTRILRLGTAAGAEVERR